VSKSPSNSEGFFLFVSMMKAENNRIVDSAMLTLRLFNILKKLQLHFRNSLPIFLFATFSNAPNGFSSLGSCFVLPTHAGIALMPMIESFIGFACPSF
jgi:hypothetical protein